MTEMVYIVYNNTFTTKFIHQKFYVVVLCSLKFTFQIVIFYLSDSRPLADFVFKLFYSIIIWVALLSKTDIRCFFMTNSSRNNCDVIKQWKA